MEVRTRLAFLFILAILLAGHLGAQILWGAESGPLEAQRLSENLADAQPLSFSGMPTAGTATDRALTLGETAPPTQANISAVLPSTTPIPKAADKSIAVERLPDLSKFVKAKDTEHFSYYAEPDSYALQNMDAFAEEAERLLQEINDRVDGILDHKASFYLYSASHSDFSGLSFMSPPLIYQEYSASQNKDWLKAVIGHELTHLLTTHIMGYSENPLHLEGVAHWATEAYWASAAGEPFDKRVRRCLALSILLPLTELSTQRSLWRGATQMVAYDQAGSFVGYLIQVYGLDQFKRVYLRSNYEEVYGKSLLDLESDWVSYLSRLGNSL